jgi:transcription-repair coupling factor (superfamily II helicase)
MSPPATANTQAYSPLTPPGAPASGTEFWSAIPEPAQTLALSHSALQHDGLTLVICADTNQAIQMEESLRFFSAGQALEVLHLPDWETLPYDTFSPHQDIVSERLATLNRLRDDGKRILVVPVTALMQCTPDPAYLAQMSLALKAGQTLDASAFRRKLADAGYVAVDTVYEHGEFAMRGSIIDLYPMGSPAPIRIDLFDDEIDTLRYFDTETQRTTERVEAISLLPAKEYPLDKDSINRFKNNWHEAFSVDHAACPLYQDISAGINSPGIEYFLPLFYGARYSLLDHLGKDCRVTLLAGVHEAAEHFWDEIQSRFDEYGIDPLRPLLPPDQVFQRHDQLFAQLKDFGQIRLRDSASEANGAAFDCQALPDIAINRRAQQPLQALKDLLDATDYRVLFCAESAGRAETLREHLDSISVKPESVSSWEDFITGDASPALCVAPLFESCVIDTPGLIIISEDQLFGEKVRQRAVRDSGPGVNPDLLIKNLTELRINAPVVHTEHGVGRYRGLITLDIEGNTAEFLHLEYADDAKLYVPVASLHVINRYMGADDELAPLHKLGSEQWSKARKKAQEQVRDAAAELLHIYAQRAARKGFKFDKPEDEYRRFCDGFPFEETEDQLNAINAVVADMQSEQSMDRLVCGDVGFGKTEVALRAAFVAVQNSKQVVVLVPTTLLAQQHYDNFRDRFSDWPVTVEVLSRFRSAGEQSEVEKRLTEGKVDIVIGTHKLLQKSMKYKRLGLVIIDEEHRFGVKQKETLKALRSDVDILNLTATPIPRTLNMAMSGLRDLSIIATPPARRLSVKTFVREYHKPVVREAVLREILRGGQVYYLHNEVKTIKNAAETLQELVPEARITIAHGQMRERELERIMSDFHHKRFNVLVCTTIIETGIDIPNANTIMIDRADKFGLAQLHQLRGRVGRSHHQAYAYLFTPHRKALTKDAEKRLEAIEQAGDLGAGFTLATHDLEIRGAGELLGEDQSGMIQSVGFSLYMEMLDRAVKTLQNGGSLEQEEPFELTGDLNLHVPALIPDDYLPDVHNRLTFYKRISALEDKDAITDLREEMIDRFGPLPEPVKTLFRLSLLRQRCDALGIRKIDCGAKGGKLEFANNTSVEPFALVTLVQQQSMTYRMDGASGLRFSETLSKAEDRFRFLDKLLDTLSAPVK